ncbi:hypothetical protein N0V93_008795 [Gnomoniopsis smithogilvyi]|uniref:1,3-beta-glucanosyltransferase n=1 Tax=Gnomoniopsis smithogilvyi TaxID=1191159 RepID=A0A9W9CV42_9PEZI|nr:hypothetical protein N0V93_008795 [Gnomoniopsis smithogilvyi]
MGFTNILRAAAAALVAEQALAAVDPLTAKVSPERNYEPLAFLPISSRQIANLPDQGQYLFYSSNGTQFFIKGVAYQQGIAPGGASESTTTSTFIDSLADTASCTRDIPLLQELGTNTVRVYAIDPTADHSVCMNALDAAGIYVIADLSVPGESINRDSPAWTTDLYTRYAGVIDNLGQYQNTLGFFAGNEVTNNKTNSNSAAFVKAAVRDMKAYITSKNFGRWIGVGYATNDDADTRDLLANYFNCGTDQTAAVDFWGYNIYEWCGQSTFESSGYQERTQAFANYSVPAFFSEYGCNNPGGANGRVFQDTPVLYSDLMNKVWSGGIVYEYFQEQNDFGLVELSGSQVTKMEDFQPLANAIASVNANASDTTTVTMSSYTSSNVPRACPAVAANSWLASDILPPTPNTTLCENMVASSACVVSDATAADADSMASLFGTVCGLDATACKGITANATTGKYGEFVMCNTTQQLTNALNTYYTNQKKASTACDFNGAAKVVTPSETLIPASSSSSSGSSSSSVSTSDNSTVPALTPSSSSGSPSSIASGSTTGAGGNGSTGTANNNGALSANSNSSTQSSGDGTSGAHRTTTMLGSAGWAGSLLMAVGAVAITL